MGKDQFYIQIWTEHFLGTEEYAKSFLELLANPDLDLVPDLWNDCEPIRYPFNEGAREEVIRAWSRVGKSFTGTTIFFRRKKPSVTIMVEIWKGRVPSLNHVTIWLPHSARHSWSEERLISIMTELIRWSGAVYATCQHSTQAHKMAASGTPLLRLESLFWFNYFGKPYIEMFGRNVLENAGFHALTTQDGGVIALTAPAPDDPKLTNSPEHLQKLEGNLGSGVFASDFESSNVRRTPLFDLRETVTTVESTTIH